MGHLSPMCRAAERNGNIGSGTLLKPWAITLGIRREGRIIARHSPVCGKPRISPSATFVLSRRRRDSRRCITGQAATGLHWVKNSVKAFGKTLIAHDFKRRAAPPPILPEVVRHGTRGTISQTHHNDAQYNKYLYLCQLLVRQRRKNNPMIWRWM